MHAWAGAGNMGHKCWSKLGGGSHAPILTTMAEDPRLGANGEYPGHHLLVVGGKRKVHSQVGIRRQVLGQRDHSHREHHLEIESPGNVQVLYLASPMQSMLVIG